MLPWAKIMWWHISPNVQLDSCEQSDNRTILYNINLELFSCFISGLILAFVYISLIWNIRSIDANSWILETGQ